ncbi:MAG: Uncharacterised protein [Polaribacter sp. SA4-10]|nr:MAG: Uncharacterised protein [Polaribacter sp. SA4-10]
MNAVKVVTIGLAYIGLPTSTLIAKKLNSNEWCGQKIYRKSN